jgi:hypothetical protein
VRPSNSSPRLATLSPWGVVSASDGQSARLPPSGMTLLRTARERMMKGWNVSVER